MRPEVSRTRVSTPRSLRSHGSPRDDALLPWRERFCACIPDMCITTVIHMRPAVSIYVLPNSGVPIYRQLMDQLKAQVAGGRLAAGAFLPSVRQVAEELQVNPMTVSK